MMAANTDATIAMRSLIKQRPGAGTAEVSIAPRMALMFENVECRLLESLSGG